MNPYEPTGHKGVRRYRLKSGDVRYYAQSWDGHRVVYLGRHSSLGAAIAAVTAFDAAHPRHPGRRCKPMPPKAAAELAAMEAAAKEQATFDTAIDEIKRPPGRDERLCVACGAGYAKMPEEGRCTHCGGYHFETVRIPDHPDINNYPRHVEKERSQHEINT